ncbi:MAG: Glu/Leu/Phe/Val dehydrogenase [Myxococcales bacterium]|nr:Glu/Leu/Phe/Val dehydrogenase [Myxococcales bacterium]MCB9552262.1 Glu/Leu/Phe/Val dehydrogenase [Myxococcales bacterium]
MNFFERLAQRAHEQVVLCHDEVTGLRAIIAIHDTTLGPALGGTRFWQYASDGDALEDALRLARGMTYKSAAAGLNLGGGKAVIIGNAKTDKNEALFRSYGRFIQGISGRYITAEDVGTTVRDMEWVRMETDHVVGISRSLGGSGDPSPFTALGVFEGMKSALKWQTGSESFEKRTVAVQGVGHVGYHLVRHLKQAGATVLIADIDTDNLARVTSEFSGVEVVDPKTIHAQGCDIFAPCALGAVINDRTLPELRCGIVAGCANNVLAEDRHGEALADRGILYAPDYVVNAGGLINVANELEGYNTDRATQSVKAIYDITTRIFQIARDEGVTTAKAADTLAERRIKGLQKVKDHYIAHPPRRLRRL